MYHKCFKELIIHTNISTYYVYVIPGIYIVVKTFRINENTKLY